MKVLGTVCSFLGRPWRRGAVFIIGSVSALCGAGSGGVLMAFLRMESSVAPWINIYGGVECFYVDCFLNSPFYPILLGGKCGEIFFSKVMFVFFGVLEHGGFVLP